MTWKAQSTKAPCVGIVLLLTSLTSLAIAEQGHRSEHFKCRKTYDCALIKSACDGPKAVNKGYKGQARRVEWIARDNIKRYEALSCAGWLDDPFVGAEAICAPSSEDKRCTVRYKDSKYPRQKPSAE